VQIAIKTLIQIHGIINTNMTKSGTHESDPMDFGDAAIKQCVKGKMMSCEVVYYFYIHCMSRDAIITGISHQLRDEIKGSGGMVDDDGASINRKKGKNKSFSP
jgi:hypothetical protein